MIMKEYCLQFNQLSKYAPDTMVDLRVSISKFVIGVYGLVVKEYRTAMLIGYMDLARLIIYAQQIEVEKFKERERRNKKTRTGQFEYGQTSLKGEIICIFRIVHL